MEHLAVRDAAAAHRLVEDPARGLAHAHERRDDDVVHGGREPEAPEERRQRRIPVRDDDELQTRRPERGEDGRVSG